MDRNEIITNFFKASLQHDLAILQAGFDKHPGLKDTFLYERRDMGSNKVHFTAFQQACSGNKESTVSIAKLFLDNGADPMQVLIIAISRGNIELLELLLEKGVDFYAQYNADNTYLDMMFRYPTMAAFALTHHEKILANSSAPESSLAILNSKHIDIVLNLKYIMLYKLMEDLNTKIADAPAKIAEEESPARSKQMTEKHLKDINIYTSISVKLEEIPYASDIEFDLKQSYLKLEEELSKSFPKKRAETILSHIQNHLSKESLYDEISKTGKVVFDVVAAEAEPAVELSENESDGAYSPDSTDTEFLDSLKDFTAIWLGRTELYPEDGL